MMGVIGWVIVAAMAVAAGAGIWLAWVVDDDTRTDRLASRIRRWRSR
jgi:hypothetical protein